MLVLGDRWGGIWCCGEAGGAEKDGVWCRWKKVQSNGEDGALQLKSKGSFTGCDAGDCSREESEVNGREV